MKKFIELIFRPVVFLYERIFLRPKINIKRLYKYLKKIGWNYHILDEKEGDSDTITLDMKIKGKFIPVNIRIFYNEYFLEFAINDSLTIPPDINRNFFKFLIETQQDFPLGRFNYNSESGLLNFSMCFPIGGGTISFHQFRACMKNVAQCGDIIYSKVLHKPQELFKEQARNGKE